VFAAEFERNSIGICIPLMILKSFREQLVLIGQRQPSGGHLPAYRMAA
jgi:hypothetical protein